MKIILIYNEGGRKLKVIDINTPLYDLVEQYPEVQEIMYELGFKDIRKPGMLQTVGRYVSIAKGMKVKKVPVEQIKQAFEAHGFVVEGV